MVNDEIFEVIYYKSDDAEGDYLGKMTGEEILESFPEVTEEDLERIIEDGEGSIILNIIAGDLLYLYYVGKD